MKNVCSIKREMPAKDAKMELASDTPYCNGIISLSFLLACELLQIRTICSLCL